MKQLYRKDNGVKIAGTFDKTPCVAQVTEWAVSPAGKLYATAWSGSEMYWDDQYTETNEAGVMWLVDEEGEQVLATDCELREEE